MSKVLNQKGKSLQKKLIASLKQQFQATLISSGHMKTVERKSLMIYTFF